MSATHPLHSLPLSPSSPLESGVKRHKRRLSDDNLSDSPASPLLMSVTANGYVSSFGDARSDPSQILPGSAEMQRQQSATALPTPANSVAGSMKASDMEDADQHRDKRQRMDTEEREEMIPGLSAQPTNHEREAGIDAISSKPAREDADYGIFLAKTVHPRVTRLRPNPNEHLISLYGLNPMLQNVARLDPATGEKINPMRKSYEGQVKGFELAGINKAVKKDAIPPFNEGRLMTLYRMAPKIDRRTPDEMQDKLKEVMKMQYVKVRNHQEWEKILGFAADKPKVATQQSIQPAVPVRPMAGTTKPQTKVHNEPIRARRQGKRRKYDDDSFEGYGGGYADEDLSDSDGDGGRKRRRKTTDYDEY